MNYLQSFREKSPLYFHRLKEGETIEMIAQKYEVSPQIILAENPRFESKPGEVVVINLR